MTLDGVLAIIESGWKPISVAGYRRSVVCRLCERCRKPGAQSTTGLCLGCKKDAWIEDLVELIKLGEGWGTICDRLGLSPDAIDRRCWRYDRSDIASLWRAQVTDHGSFDTPGWLAAQLAQHRRRLRSEQAAA